MATGWSDEELRASADTYMQMLTWEADGHAYVKSELYRELAKKFPRTAKSFEFRMQNISYVLLLLGRQWLPGLKPASNVGANITARLLKFLKPALASNKALAPKLSRYALSDALGEMTKDGPLIFPFTNEIGPAELDWTQETEEVWGAAFEGETSVKTPLEAPPGVLEPQQTETVTQSFQRDKSVIDWVLVRANGRCECCNSTAPFKDRNNEPFLEVHHLRRLADKGSDRISNAVAICPNCHRRLHFGIDSEQHLKRIYDTVDGLISE